ncbi:MULTISPECIES: MucR family transcriptional regulator [Brevundimonas]|uniref:Transcriptional regulator n=1 Tax=Brevundimonas abyssalis TAR-001 TaxID=1391729 RepID=A0A8E0TSQ6_9CAUL|nr:MULTISPECIES: MucR family transcriptional regulator [Brevundimonas]GAD60519.1 transcriptional regulator [Brevundimonas abyssalis TAR-001]
MDETPSETDLVGMTADIVSAYVSNNTVAPEGLAALISGVHGALAGMSSGAEPEPEPLVPALPIRKSITPDYLISLEDGSRYKSLKRHLSAKYGLTPGEYRAKWGLPHDYPMVAPNYAKARSDLARSMGLGQGVRRPVRPGRKPKA